MKLFAVRILSIRAEMEEKNAYGRHFVFGRCDCRDDIEYDTG